MKHILAFSVFLSLDPLQFATNNLIENYSSLVEFLGKVHDALPDFAMLEDYVPETDWGEIKIPSDDDVFDIFYGGSLERIPDYIDAFRLAHSAAPAPLRDVKFSIRLQDFIISRIDRSIVGDPSKAAPGHIELPSEQFWRDCRAALLAAAEEPSWAKMSTDLVARLGSLSLSINLAYAQARLVDAVDASFESQCVREWIQGVAALLGDTVPINTLNLARMDDGSPRYSLTVLPRTIDAPEMARAKLPEPTQYKIARRELAKVFQALGTEPGRYELAAAKATIDPARDEFRKHIHDAIGSLELHSLLTYCIQQHDALILEYSHHSA